MAIALQISKEYISLHTLQNVLADRTVIALTPDCRERLVSNRAFLENKLEDENTPYYGINTGFGSMYNVPIGRDELTALQSNLVRSHAAGLGDVIPPEIARTVLLLKIISLAKGYSGVRPAIVEQLISYYNKHLIPVMFTFGSLGASGDLAPLSHLALTLMGEGHFYSGEAQIPAAEALHAAGLPSLQLQAKEGLALVNGTQFSCGYAVANIHDAQRLMQVSNLCGALSLEAFNCNPAAFDQRIHVIRNQRGQSATADVIRNYLHDSAIARNGDKQLQDPYAFRCIPQVHGASFDVIYNAAQTIEQECNAVTDNPLVFSETDAILSGGNFHGQPIALVMDFLGIALAELGSISERRTYQLLSGQRGLPPYLTTQSGVRSGLMIAQYAAASVVDRNRVLCTPASVGNAVTSNGQEDHVSMSANASVKAHEICRNCKSILAIEFLTAMQALDLRKPAKTSPLLEEIKTAYRREVPVLNDDIVVHDVIKRTESFIDTLMFRDDQVVLPKTPARNSV